MVRIIMIAGIVMAMSAQQAPGATAENLAAEQALFDSIKIAPEQLKPLGVETELVADGEARAVICHADIPQWRDAATVIQWGIMAATGTSLPLVTDAELDMSASDGQNVILLGHLDNNKAVARLYHNFFVCLDTGYTGREGYVIRSVHNPFGTGRNYILVGGSSAEGTKLGAKAFVRLVAERAKGKSLTLGRLLELHFDEADRAERIEAPVTEKQRDAAVAAARKAMFSPGQGRTGTSRLVTWGTRYQRTADPLAGEVYRDLMLALLEYYETDEYITGEGLARYDRDFRDAWTYTVGILWDLHEESGLFSDEERLKLTNLMLKLALECVAYQRYNRPDVLEHWKANEDIVHNHNTFPALGVYFVGNYFRRHYGLPVADNWVAVAHGIFRGQRHSSKPLEDAGSYQWLPVEHTMTYSLAEGDDTYFEEGHARETALVAMMLLDNAGYQAAFGDCTGYRQSSYVANTLQKIAWYYKDPQILWGAQLATGTPRHILGQPYHVDIEPEPAAQIAGVTHVQLPRMCYDYAGRSPQYATKPNLPWEQTFDKLTLRGGVEPDDEYMLLDGFGRGTHMHFDANAIIRFSKGGEPLLVDGEYIKNAPKYHSSVVIIRDGRAELTPAVTGLGRADELTTAAYTRTWISEYNGAEWTRRIIWRRGEYFLVVDEVVAEEGGDFTLRCCWRPWGDTVLEDGTLTVQHKPMTMVIENADGASCRLETMRVNERMAVSRLSQQVSVRLEPGESYRFINLLHAERQEQARALSVKRVGDGLVVVERPEGAELVAIGPAAAKLPGLDTDAEMVLLSADSIVAAGCTRLAAANEQLSAAKPVSVELNPAAGTGFLVAGADTEVKLKTAPGVAFDVSGKTVVSDADGVATFTAAAGRTALGFDAVPMPAAFVSALNAVGALPAAGPSAEPPQYTCKKMQPAWACEGFEPGPMPLKIAAITCDEPTGSKGPVDKLIDDESSGSQTSAMWRAGVTPTIALELPAQRHITGVLLREWHMSEGWDIGSRKLQISSDGFRDDVRTIEGPFEDVGRKVFGGNINTLMRVEVGQKARQLRLVVSPAREDSMVYLAEIDVLGTEPGVLPDITAVAAGDLDGNGKREFVAASGAGDIVAVGADGTRLWVFETGDGVRINALACADVNGDGKDEVIYGANAERLGLVSAEGQELWHVKPPKFRGIRSDVITVLAADVNGDGLPEVVCGCLNWMYFAYDKDGEMVWKNVIYAHSATVSHADDFDGDGLPEIVGGNAYYTLNIIDNDGKRLLNGGRFGPEQTAVSSADVDGDGLPEVLIGTDGGELLCFKADGTKLWEVSLGDKVTRIMPVDLTGNGAAEIVCSAESANVFALALDGSVLWRRALPDGVGDMLVAPGDDGPLLVAAAGEAGVMVLDAKGELVSQGLVEGRAASLALSGRRIVTATSQGTLSSFDVAGL